MRLCTLLALCALGPCLQGRAQKCSNESDAAVCAEVAEFNREATEESLRMLQHRVIMLRHEEDTDVRAGSEEHEDEEQEDEEAEGDEQDEEEEEEVDEIDEQVVNDEEYQLDSARSRRRRRHSKRLKKACLQIGITNVSGFRNSMLLTPRSSQSEEDQVFFPIMSSLDYFDGKSHPQVNQVLIVFHGVSRDVDRYFCSALGATQRAGHESDTLVIAPLFPKRRLSASRWSPKLPADVRSLYWSSGDFMGGKNSNRDHIPSYRAIDSLLEDLWKQAQNGTLPKLKKVTMAGFSAGCQTLSRWAFFSKMPLTLQDAGLPVQIIASDCGSYLYPGPSRPSSECSPLRNTGPDHICTQFADGEKVRADCPDYDDFKYGLSNIPTRHYTYLRHFRESEEYRKEVIDMFPKKDMHFLLGQNDACNCLAGNVADYSVLGNICVRPGTTCHRHGKNSSCCDSFPSKTLFVSPTCDMMVQGSNRLQRGLNFVSFLQDFYARRGSFFTPKVATFGGLLTHSSGEMMNSTTFSSWVWGGGA
eukprot:TRINITY_DN12104_c0_g1_i1.p1 TRINITY_DN12104_c0_g1~~TRINITY_DN12104_c0_g1_i1.p1  ORF type:complete len:550 (+),score=98.43 TRINITY_DN12104_c0_g1_i1:63-1652(+)